MLSKIALPDQGVLIADHGDRKGLRLFTVHGQFRSEALAGPDWLHEPVALACDAKQHIYVLDRDGERVQRLLPDLRHDALIVDLAEFHHGQ